MAFDPKKIHSHVVAIGENVKMATNCEACAQLMQDLVTAFDKSLGTMHQSGQFDDKEEALRCFMMMACVEAARHDYGPIDLLVMLTDAFKVMAGRSMTADKEEFETLGAEIGGWRKV